MELASSLFCEDHLKALRCSRKFPEDISVDVFKIFFDPSRKVPRKNMGIGKRRTSSLNKRWHSLEYRAKLYAKLFEMSEWKVNIFLRIRPRSATATLLWYRCQVLQHLH